MLEQLSEEVGFHELLNQARGHINSLGRTIECLASRDGFDFGREAPIGISGGNGIHLDAARLQAFQIDSLQKELDVTEMLLVTPKPYEVSTEADEGLKPAVAERVPSYHQELPRFNGNDSLHMVPQTSKGFALDAEMAPLQPSLLGKPIRSGKGASGWAANPQSDVLAEVAAELSPAILTNGRSAKLMTDVESISPEFRQSMASASTACSAKPRMNFWVAENRCHCGNVFLDDAIFCRMCGSHRPNACSSCGNILAGDALFCRKCGTRRAEAAPEAPLVQGDDNWMVKANSRTTSTLRGSASKSMELHAIWLMRREPRINEEAALTKGGTRRSGDTSAAPSILTATKSDGDFAAATSVEATRSGATSSSKSPKWMPQLLKAFTSNNSEAEADKAKAFRRAVRRSAAKRYSGITRTKSDKRRTLVERLGGRIVTSPTSASRLLWDLFGMLLVCYDIIAIPMQWLSPPRTLFSDILSWVTTIFWTMDIGASFCVGFHAPNGFIEFDMRKIAVRYAQSWLLFDLLVVGVDWGATILGLSQSTEATSGTGEVGFMRIGRTARFMRMLRLLRLLKVSGTAADIFERIHSEFVRIILGVVKLIVFIIAANHIIACAFYGIGTYDDEWKDSWVVYHKIQERSFVYQYTTSLHWSLTQFTPASMEITPRNALERAYTTAVIVVAMVTFSSFISSLTSAITQLRSLDEEKLAQQALLRRYMRQNGITTSLTARIWMWLKVTREGQTKRRLHEKDVNILRVLPSKIIYELQEQVYSPVLIAHPFFFQFSVAHAKNMKKLFSCVQESSVGKGKELFNSGEVAGQMYFVVSGSFNYFAIDDHSKTRMTLVPSTREDILDGLPNKPIVQEGAWCCEPVLWVGWKHRGNLLAMKHCEVFGFAASRFHRIVSEDLTEVWEAHQYARLFVTRVRECDVNDIWADFDILQELAQDAFSNSCLEWSESPTLSTLPLDGRVV